jgi:hypothetical protein|tara:strand:- start:2015 stop:2185 length:171 start_codon:yes stop_codon:yes gene_type:complete
MVALIRPLLFKFVNTPQVKQLIIDLLTKLAASTDNTVDDKAVIFIKNGLFPGSKSK